MVSRAPAPTGKPQKYAKEVLLGSGAQGSCYKVKGKTTGDSYVIKIIPLKNMTDRQKQEAKNEHRVLGMLDHPNII